MEAFFMLLYHRKNKSNVSKRPSPCLKASQSARPLSEIIKFYDKGKINEGFV